MLSVSVVKRYRPAKASKFINANKNISVNILSRSANTVTLLPLCYCGNNKKTAALSWLK